MVNMTKFYKPQVVIFTAMFDEKVLKGACKGVYKGSLESYLTLVRMDLIVSLWSYTDCCQPSDFVRVPVIMASSQQQELY